MKLGLTGGIGCGKSSAGAYFKQLGWLHADADQIVRRLLESDSAVHAALFEHFGPDALLPAGHTAQAQPTHATSGHRTASYTSAEHAARDSVATESATSEPTITEHVALSPAAPGQTPAGHAVTGYTLTGHAAAEHSATGHRPEAEPLVRHENRAPLPDSSLLPGEASQDKTPEDAIFDPAELPGSPFAGGDSLLPGDPPTHSETPAPDAEEDAEDAAQALAIATAPFALLDAEGRPAFTANRPFLARKIFADALERAWLEGLLHPRVRRQWEAMLTEAADTPIVVEIPLLFEKNLEKHFDLTVCVEADHPVQLARLQARGMSLTDAQARIASQMPLVEKIARADKILSNNGSEDFLRAQVSYLSNELLAQPTHSE